MSTQTAYDSDGTILVDGRRTFVLGAYAPPPAPDREQGLRALAGSGVRMVRCPPDPAALDAAHRAGLSAWVAVGLAEQGALEHVRALRDHPALWFWETVDEPAWTWGEARCRARPEPLVATYEALRAEDPDHLVYLNHAPTNLISTLRAYAPSTDITACDIYPVIGPGAAPQYALFPDGMQGDLLNTYVSQVGQYTDKMRAVAGASRPLFMVLQGFAWEMLRPEGARDPGQVLYPTYAQARFMAWQAVVRGANGILYWGLHSVPGPSPAERDSSFWADLRRVLRELAALHDVLVAEPAPLEIETVYHEVGHSVDLGLQVASRQRAGHTYLFAVNADKNPVRATLRPGGAAVEHRPGSAVEVLGEGRRLALQDGALTDDWVPFGVHLYRLGAA